MIRNNRIVEAKGDKKQQTKEQKFRQYKLPWHLHGGDNFFVLFYLLYGLFSWHCFTCQI
jgi:hypothetical protein